MRAQEWADAFAAASNDDPEIQAHGEYFTCTYLLDAADRSYAIKSNPRCGSPPERGSLRLNAADGALPVSGVSGRVRAGSAGR